MSQGVRVVTCYVYRRKRRGYVPGQGETVYEVWLLLGVRSEEESDAVPESVLNPVFGADADETLGERLKEALAESMAGRVEEMVWKTADDLSEQQVADLVVGLPDIVKTLVQKRFEGLAGAVGVPGPVAELGADVTAIFVLRPVLEPVEGALHALEVAGIFIGLVTGLHPLVIFCAKHLARDEIGSALATVFEEIIKPSDAQTPGDNSSMAGRVGGAAADDGPVAGGKTAPTPGATIRRDKTNNPDDDGVRPAPMEPGLRPDISESESEGIRDLLYGLGSSPISGRRSNEDLEPPTSLDRLLAILMDDLDGWRTPRQDGSQVTCAVL